MTVRSTSALAYEGTDRTTLKQQVRVWIRENQPCTRRMIATGMGVDTATVSGLVTPLVRGGFIDETGHMTCSVTGRQAIMLESPVQQMRLFAV